MVKISAALAKQLVKKKEHKFNAVRTKCLYGHNHDSRKEAMWCIKLMQMQKEGMIHDLQRQVSFDLDIGMNTVTRHIVDFYYKVSNCGTTRGCVVEVKGMPTPEWKLKHKMFLALYPHIVYQVV